MPLNKWNIEILPETTFSLSCGKQIFSYLLLDELLTRYYITLRLAHMVKGKGRFYWRFQFHVLTVIEVCLLKIIAEHLDFMIGHLN